MRCQISTVLAYLMFLYTVSSIYYLIRTQFIGTPFKDSLTSKQQEIQQKSAYLRKTIFIQGIMIGCFLMFIWKPFHNC